MARKKQKSEGGGGTALMTRSKTAVATKEDVAAWEQAMANHAKEDAERIGSGEGGSLSIRNSRFKYMGEDLGGDSINLIVLDFVHARRYYEGEFDEDDVTPPSCAATNLDGKNMVPFDNVPNKQSDECNSCWANQWGSDERRARAKACKSGRRLICIPAGEDYMEDPDPDLVRLRLPVKSARPWDDYIAKLTATTGYPCFGVITEVSFDRTVDYPKLKFKAVGQVDPSYGKVVLAARERARQQLLAAPDFSATADGDDAPRKPADGKKRMAKPAKGANGKANGKGKERGRSAPPPARDERPARRSKFS